MYRNHSTLCLALCKHSFKTSYGYHYSYFYYLNLYSLLLTSSGQLVTTWYTTFLWPIVLLFSWMTVPYLSLFPQTSSRSSSPRSQLRTMLSPDMWNIVLSRELPGAPVTMFMHSPASGPICVAFLPLLMDPLSLPLSKVSTPIGHHTLELLQPPPCPPVASFFPFLLNDFHWHTNVLSFLPS